MEDNQKAERPSNVGQCRSQSAIRLKSNGGTVSAALIATSLAASIAAVVRLTVATTVEMALAQPLWARTTLDPVTLLYAVSLIILQLSSVRAITFCNGRGSRQAASLGGHLIVYNLLYVASQLLSIRTHLPAAEMVSNCAFVNTSALYMRYNADRSCASLPEISGPLAWSFKAIYWSCTSLVSLWEVGPALKIIGLILLWGAFCGSAFHAVQYMDYTMGVLLACLTATMGLYDLKSNDHMALWTPCIVAAGLFYERALAAIASSENKPVGDTDTVVQGRLHDTQVVYSAIDAAHAARSGACIAAWPADEPYIWDGLVPIA